jgi:16S rRNA processing protein RimM
LTERRVLVGVITGAHGIKGEVRVKTFTVEPGGLGAYGPLTTNGGTRLEVSGLRPGKSGEAIVRFAGVADRNAAEALRGAELYILREALPEPEEGEFYLADLVGLRAEDPQGVVLGLVRALHNFGASDVVEIEFTGGGTEFIPFTDANVPLVDVAADRMVVVPPRDDEAG